MKDDKDADADAEDDDDSDDDVTGVGGIRRQPAKSGYASWGSMSPLGN